MLSYFLIELCSIDMLCICIHHNSSSLYLQYNIVELYSHWIVLYWHLTCYLLYTFIIPVQCIYNTTLFELYQLWFCSNALHIFLIIHSLRWLSERHIMLSYRPQSIESWIKSSMFSQIILIRRLILNKVDNLVDFIVFYHRQ